MRIAPRYRAPWYRVGVAIIAVLAGASACSGGSSRGAPPPDGHGTTTTGRTSALPSDGPLDAGIPGSELGFPVPANTLATIGVTFLSNHGSAPAVIKSVELVGPSRLRLVDSAVHPLDRKESTWLGNVGYPPAHATLLPLGTPIAHHVGSGGDPAHDAEVLLGIRLLTAGTAEAEGIRLVYEAGGHRYQLIDQTRIVLCGPAVKGDCSRPQPSEPSE